MPEGVHDKHLRFECVGAGGFNRHAGVDIETGNRNGGSMSDLIAFPHERTKKTKLDRAIERAEKILRLCRLSDRRYDDTFRRDQGRLAR